MTTKNEIRVGIIGFGFSSKTFHDPLISATEGYRIVAVGSRRPADVKAVLPDAEVVHDPKALAKRDDVDLVIIASPNDTHASLAEFAIRAGKNVVVEKPFTITTKEARALAALSAETGTLLSVFQNRRWDSDFLTVQEAIRKNLTGHVAEFESRLDRFRPLVRNRWREIPGPGSGLLYDLGPHLVDQTLLLFGMPDSVQATIATQRHGGRTDDFFHIVMRYGDMIATLQASSLVSGGSARFAVHGEQASLIKPNPDIQEDQLRMGVMPGSEEWGIDPDDAVLYDGDTRNTRRIKAARGDQRGYYVALRDAILKKAPNPVSPHQGATIIAVIEAAIRSNGEGRRIVPNISDEERASWPAPIESRQRTR